MAVRARESGLRLLALIPGLLLATALAWASVWFSDYVGVSLMGYEKTPVSAVMVALILGLVINHAVKLPARFGPGSRFAVKKVLRLGIILLGIRLSFFDVLRLGALGTPIVVLCILAALLITTRLNRWLDLPKRLGTLIAVGTSICGISAIVATGPAIDAKEEELAYAVAVITVFGIVATLLYPYAAYSLFDGDPIKAGLFLGTSIHDTSQVTGAGLVFSDVYGAARCVEVATVTKLVRNVFMAAVIPLMALYTHRAGSSSRSSKGELSVAKLFPRFIIGFLALAALRSVGDAGIHAGGNAFGFLDPPAWAELHQVVNRWAVSLLVVALAGVGLSTSFHSFRGLGIKPFLVGLGAALTVGVVSLATISLLGNLVTF
jgi:uncharacterized integral membrane protein (TIGR00698 family)